MQNKDTLFNTIDTHNNHQIVSTLLSPLKQIAHLFLLIFICFSLASFNIITLHAAENESASSVNMEVIPNYVESSSTSKVNSITHQENNDTRNLEQWPKIDPSDPFSHRVLYQEWKTPDSTVDKKIDEKSKQKNNQAFSKWLKQLNDEK